uniref:RAS p21 protein activator 3 n=1 Tax=Oncorhynchus tshawytscha TaxID=74940 RepID=A0AAZ3RPS7_ONCTS
MCVCVTNSLSAAGCVVCSVCVCVCVMCVWCVMCVCVTNSLSLQCVGVPGPAHRECVCVVCSVCGVFSLCSVLECQGLPIVNGQCDPYAAVSLLGPSRSEAKKTKVKRKTNNPQFDETFYFEVRGGWCYLSTMRRGSVDCFNVFPSQPVSASAAHILGEVCREKQEAAIPLVRLFLHYGNILPFLSAVAHAEVNRTQDPNTIFRGNSLTSKCIDETMKLAGNHYLQVTLRSMIDEICTDHKPCEIDPVKLKESENLETNRENLRQYVDRIFNMITTSGVRCPTVMCDIFFSLRESAATRFEVDQDVRYTAVSSFIFLRFFAPAILSPNLFQLRPHHPDPATSRTLTLISKTIQTLGSLAKSKSASFKETYMAAFYDYFNEQKYGDAVKNTSLSDYLSWRSLPPSVSHSFLLLSRFMIKRAQGRNRFGMKNFKKRWFRLTNHEFTYHKTKGEGALCRIPIENILAVERLEEESFKMKNMFQVIQPERALYIQANNCVEARDWIDILTKVSQCNRKRLSTYHPSAYLNGHWLCCKMSADTEPGCTPCTGGLPANIQLDVDGDREAERIYCLFSTYMNKLVNMQEACGSRSVYDGPEQEEYSCFLIDDPRETYKTLRVIISSVQTLEQQHTKYKRDMFRKTKIGSQ